MQAYNVTRGTWLAKDLEVADSFFKRARGLLGKAGLAPTEGLWIKPCDSIHTLGMRFAIDAVFLGRRGRVVKVVKEIRPFRLVLPAAAAASVIELPAGTVTKTGTRVGDTILMKHRSTLVASEGPATHDEMRATDQEAHYE